MIRSTNPYKTHYQRKCCVSKKVSKYFTLSTEVAIQIASCICCIFSKSANQSLILHFSFVLHISAVNKQVRCVFNQSFGQRMKSTVSKSVANLVCVIKGPCIIWNASKHSVLQFNWKSCEMQFFCHTTLLPSSFHGKYFCQLPLNNARADL